MQPISISIFILALFGTAIADFDCSKVKAGERTYDLSSLGKDVTIEHSEPTPPTTTKTIWTLNVCKAISELGGDDQCPSGTRICGIVKNEAKDKEDRLVSIIPVAGDIGDRAINPAASKGTGEVERVNLILEGGLWNEKPQKANITFECAQEDSSPTYISYQDSILKVYWKTTKACTKNKDGEKTPEKPDDEESPPVDNNPSKSGIGGFGLFVVIVFLAIAAYLIFGGIINYNRYGSTNVRDLLPHSDFWADVPYLLKDMMSRLIGSVRGDRRGGYAAV